MKKIFLMLLSPTYLVKSILTYKKIKKLKTWGKNNIFKNDGIDFISPTSISIGSGCVFNAFFKASAWEFYHNEPTGYQPTITIGDNVYFGKNCNISCLNKVVIGDGATFGDNVLINDNLHGNPNHLKDDANTHPMDRKLYSKGPIIIGENVWIGNNVSILGGVVIGSGAIIGTGSVVTHNVEPNSVWAGIPARRIK